MSVLTRLIRTRINELLASADEERSAATYLSAEERLKLPEHRKQAAADREAKQRNSHCMHPKTRGWRIVVGENVLPKVFTLGELKRFPVKSIDPRVEYLTPTGQRLDQRAFRILLNSLVEKARARKNSENAA